MKKLLACAVLGTWASLCSPVSALPSAQIGGVLQVNVQSIGGVPWQVQGASPVWTQVPLFGCTTSIVGVFVFDNPCTGEFMDRRYCYATVCRTPNFQAPLGGITTTTTFSDDCFYCIDHPECCLDLGEIDLPGYDWTGPSTCSLTGSGNVPIQFNYQIQASGPLTVPNVDVGFRGERHMSFRFVRPAGATGPAHLNVPVNFANLVLDAADAAGLEVTNGVLRMEALLTSPQLGNVFRCAIEQPVHGLATIAGTIPPGMFQRTSGVTTANGLQFDLPTVTIPANVSQANFTFSLRVSSRASNGDADDSGVAAVSPCDPFLRGDSNGDYELNVSDVVNLLGYLFSQGSAPLPFAAGDVNDDGEVNLGDAVYGLGFLFGGGPQPTEPFPLPACL
ncbi:MAG: dockerin type I repeat-containing protein [Planctomycetota bacterium]